MNHKEEMLQFVSGLEEYAKSQGLSMRILDSIADCREHIRREDLSWQELRRQIEEVMESVGQKVQQTDVTVQGQNKDSVPVEKVQAQVRKMADQCHRENRDSVSAIDERKRLNITKCMREMSEISNVEAHLEEMKDEERYKNFFQKVRASYDKSMESTAGAMLDDINSNYDHMADHMRSMFHSIGGYSNGVGSEKIYREYEVGKESVQRQLIGETKTADFGGSLIVNFADRTKEKIAEFVRGAVLRKKILTVIPIVVLLVLVAAAIIIPGIVQSAHEEEESDVIKALEQAKEVYDIFAGDDDDESIAEQILSGYLNIGRMTVNVAYVVAAVLVLIVLYVFYLRGLKKGCNRRICEQCGAYLRTELAAFEQAWLVQKADEAISRIVADCEQQYLNILNRIFAGTKYEEKPAGPASEYETLQAKWSKLKYN